MDARKFMPLLMLLLLIVGAAGVSADCVWNTGVGDVAFKEVKYEAACLKYEWIHTETANDFNNYIVHASGDFTLADVNYTGKTFELCTVEPGSTVAFYVQAFDGNAEGHYCGFDYNVTTATGSYTGAVRLMVYTLFVVLAGFVGIIILIMVILRGIKLSGIKIPGMK